MQNSKAFAEYQARKNALSISNAIFRAAADLLQRSQSYPGNNSKIMLTGQIIFSNHLINGSLMNLLSDIFVSIYLFLLEHIFYTAS